MKQLVLPVVLSLGFLAGAPALADEAASAEVKGEAKVESRGFGDRLKSLFGFGKDKGTQVAEKTEKAKDKAKAKSDEASDEAKGQSEAAREHAAEVKAEGQAKAEDAKDEGSNKQGASESAKEDGDNRQGAGLGIGAEIKIEGKGKSK